MTVGNCWFYCSKCRREVSAVIQKLGGYICEKCRRVVNVSKVK